MAAFKKISTSFKVILTLVALLAAGYIFKLSTGHKQVILADTDTVAVNHLPQKHRKHHRLKNHAQITVSPKPVTNIPQIARTPTTLAKPEIIKPPLAVTRPLPVRNQPDSITANNSFIYTTYVQPNVTGIVKLREQDNFYANTLANIPANSKVQVLKRGETYYQVSYDHTIGFVPKWTLQVK
jgi:hypothetical protein